MDWPPFVVVGNPGARRIRHFQAALSGLGLPPAQVLPYADLLAGRITLPAVVGPGTVVRIEAPDKDFEVERAILALGADAAAAEGTDHLSRPAVEQLTFDLGRLLPSRQWYLGFRAVLTMIQAQLAACPLHRLMAEPTDIALMFDKPRCHAALRARGLPVPRVLGPVGCFDELVERMRAARVARVFVKPAHGSSAAGVVAYQTNGRDHHATTTIELVRQAGEVRLYTSKRLRVYRDKHEIATLVDALGRQRLQVEHWLPKAGLDGRTFDLRVVVIAGRTRHVVVRLSRGPITNLHLDNERAGPEQVRRRMGEAAWHDLCQTGERVLAGFPGSLYAGIDLLVAPDFRRHAILEVNAFGDLLLETYHDGLDTYTTEVLALLGSASQPPNAGGHLAADHWASPAQADTPQAPHHWGVGRLGV